MRDDFLASYSCFAQGLLLPPTSAGSPFPLSRAPWQKFSVEVRGFEPVTLLREMYLLTTVTSPSGRARPLGEVVKRYISLKRVDFGFDYSGGSPITQTNALPAAALLTCPPPWTRERGLLSSRGARACRPSLCLSMPPRLTPRATTYLADCGRPLRAGSPFSL